MQVFFVETDIYMKYDFDDEKVTPLWKKIVKEVLIWLICIGLSILAAYLITHYALEKTNMPDDSMKETLSQDDSILINKFSYKIKEPKRMDVVVFKKENSTDSNYNIKRIIGIPGDTVKIKDGVIYINGTELKETVKTDVMTNSGLAKDGVTLAEGEYFVLGDNRNECEDSRFSGVGKVTKDEIIGKAWIRLNSVSIINELNRIDEEEE